MLRWPAVGWVAPDGTKGTRLFASVEEAQMWWEDEGNKHPDWEWVQDETTTVPGRAIFTIDQQMADCEELVRKTLLRFYAELSDLFMVRDWGTEALQPLSQLGKVGNPDRHGVASVIGIVTPEVVRELVRKNWFEVLLWRGDECLFGLDDESDVGFVLTEEWLTELEQLGVGRWMLKPEVVEGHGYGFSRLSRPQVADE